MAGERADKRTFATLDGLRGVAALFVAMRHTSFFHGLGIHGGYLAVDLFFVLSGFVIAHAYQRRLEQGLSAGRFLVMRYLRLWPVYVLGAVIGLIGAAEHALPGKDNMSLAEVARTAPFALAMLPGPHIRPMLYPVNSVAWSLALELAINAVYAFTWRWLRDVRVLAGALAASAARPGRRLSVVRQAGHRLFVERRRRRPAPRGLLLHRRPGGLSVVSGSDLWRARLNAWAPLAVLPPLLWVRLDEIVYPLICVIAVFPALVLVSAQTEPSSPRAVRLFAWLGAVSYPLYALHKPAGEIATRWCSSIQLAGGSRTPASGSVCPIWRRCAWSAPWSSATMTDRRAGC